MTLTKQRVTLSEAVRICYEELRDEGRYTIAAGVKLVQERYPEVVAAELEMMAPGMIGEKFRKTGKGRPMTPFQRVLDLPMDLADKGLTDSMSLPRPGVVPEAPEEDNAHHWVGLYRATLADVELHIVLLEAAEGHLRKRLRAFRQLLALLDPILSNGRRNEPIGPVLEEIAARERQSKAA